MQGGLKKRSRRLVPARVVRRDLAIGLAYRNEFVAGWTGPAQVEKGVVESAGYAELDVAYVAACRSSSAWQVVRRDLAILWRTVVVMAKGQGLQF
jgi:hypothetical protein